MKNKEAIDQMVIHIMINTRIPIFNKYTEKHDVRGLFDRYEKHFVHTYFNGNNRHYSIAVSDYLNKNGMNNTVELNDMSFDLKTLKRAINLRTKYMPYSSELAELVEHHNNISEKYNASAKGLNEFIKEFRKFKCKESHI